MLEEANFAYDDAFKTMEMESDELVLPLLNEMFGEHYSGKEAIRRNANEHFIEQGAGAEERRATDSLLCVEKEFLFTVESRTTLRDCDQLSWPTGRTDTFNALCAVRAPLLFAA